MKTLWLCLLLSAPAWAGEVDIAPMALPVAVLASIRFAYPGATISSATVEKEDGADTFEARVAIGARTMDLAYRADGTLLEEEEVVSLDAVPDAMRATLGARYAGWRVVRIERSVTPSHTHFEARLKKGTQSHEIVFDAQGVVVRDASETDDED